MLFYFWFFVFNVHFVHSLRSTAPHRIAFQNDYQNSYSNSNQNNLKRGNEDKETTNEYTESHLKPNLDTVNSFRGNKNRKSNTDQLFTEESNEDQLIERNIVPDSDSSIYSSSKYAEDKETKMQQPYSFGYESNDGWGNKQYRHEKKTGSVTTGWYGYKDANGIYRHVVYTADHRGFRAKIKTNEPGTASKNSAHVEIEATPVQSVKSDHRRKSDHKKEDTTQTKYSNVQQTSDSYQEQPTIRSIKKQQLKLSTINSPNDYISSNLKRDQINREDHTNREQHLNNYHLDTLVKSDQDDHENRYNLNNEDNYIKQYNDRSPINSSPIKHWNSNEAAAVGSETTLLNIKTEQNDQVDEQNDEENYQINQRAFYRARL